MKIQLTILSVLIFSIINAQHKTTFKIENLSKPENVLPVNHYNKICERLIIKDERFYSPKDRSDIYFKNTTFDNKIIVAQSNVNDSLVDFGYHSFFNGMYEAYAHHRPFVLSPDMIWLLISQGFANHINSDPEKFRNLFVDFDNKKSLVVISKDTLNWEKTVDNFSDKVDKNINDKELIKILTADFSTTHQNEKIASKITLMKSFEPYFEYVQILLVCGIPEITLEGTTKDWEKVLEKTRYISKYDLKWWTDKLEPILKEFIKASKGKIKERFWRNMFKYHSKRKYGAPKIINGWIVKFFPYDKTGKRNNLKKLVGTNMLPDEIVKVGFKLHIIDDYGKQETKQLELWSGFVGLSQNKKNFALRPEIGWLIIDKSKIKKNSFPKNAEIDKLELKITDIPKELIQIKSIKSLSLHYLNEVKVPKELKSVKIDELTINGKISKNQISEIKKLFPKTLIFINGEQINNP